MRFITIESEREENTNRLYADSSMLAGSKGFVNRNKRKRKTSIRAIVKDGDLNDETGTSLATATAIGEAGSSVTRSIRQERICRQMREPGKMGELRTAGG